MKTRDLIDRIAVDPARPAFATGRIWACILAAILSCSAIFLGMAGPRPDLSTAIFSPVVAAKTLLPLTIFLISLRVAVAMARPGSARRSLMPTLALPAGVAVLLWVRAFALLPVDRRFADVGAFSLSECVGLITVLSLLPASVAIAALRDGASPKPVLSSFLAGLAAGSGAATGYSLFCVQDNPLFFVTWYGFAILLVACLTTAAGTRFLRW